MTMSFYFLTIYTLVLHHQTIFDCRNLSKVSESMAISIFGLIMGDVFKSTYLGMYFVKNFHYLLSQKFPFYLYHIFYQTITQINCNKIYFPVKHGQKKVDTFTMQSICIVEVRKKVLYCFWISCMDTFFEKKCFFLFSWNAKSLNCFGKVDVKNW